MRLFGPPRRPRALPAIGLLFACAVGERIRARAIKVVVDVIARVVCRAAGLR